MSKVVVRIFAGLMLVTVLTGVLPVNSALAEDSSTDITIHVVKWGDTLSEIARLYDVTMVAIIEANDLVSSDHIYVGQQLTIPGAGTSGLASQTTTYVVRRGDTLGKICREFGVPLSSVVTANNLINPSRIYVGQRLVIPGSDWEPAGEPGEPARVFRHIVQPGESLTRIASRYDVPVWSIIQANNISNPSLLYVGQVLSVSTVVPDDGGAAPLVTPGQGTDVYVVQSGDTLNKIAAAFSVTLSEILSANNIADPNQIEVGQHIAIPAIDIPSPTVYAGKQIVVDLSQQRTYAFEDGELVRTFIVSTGRAETPTVTGEYRIYHKVRSQRMRGPGYDLPGVEWVMYFFEGYSFHATYWHNNFGHPMSHGCVNMRTPEAEWLYNWAPMSTAVLVIS